MPNDLSQWLTEQIRPPRKLGSRVLVLCRDRSTVSLVRRWAAQRGGVHGIEIATPATLAAQVWRSRTLIRNGEEELDEGELPEGSQALELIGQRPGLVAVARRWTRWVRMARSAGHTAPAPGWLDELVALGWGADHEERAIVHLVEQASARGLAVGEAAWSRAIALGFIGDSPFTAPWESALLEAFGASHAVLPDPASTHSTGEVLPALFVPDVVAEARAAVRFAARSPGDTLILVANDATARRVRDALHRNGFGCDWRGVLPLRGHMLASAVARGAAWFESTDPWIQVTDLAAVLRQVAFGKALHPAAEALLAHRLDTHGLEASDAWLDRRAVVTLLEHVRLLEAPLSQWLVRLQEMSSPQGSEARDRRRAAQAAALEVRLQLLAAAVQGEPVERALGHQAPIEFDADDFDAIVAELLGDDSDVMEPDAAPGTLGALRSFLVACRIDLQDDPVARAILAALGRRAHWPASPAHVAHALAGAVDPGSLVDGVQLTTYAEWDGRPARRVLLLDVHDKGLGRRPAPDPLLTEEEIGAIGAVPPSEWTNQVLGLARRAVARAEEVLAIVAAHDADGRSVVPPVQLELGPSSEAPVTSYGIDLPDLPEHRALAGLVPGEGIPSAPPDHSWGALATQATAEWYRDGRGPRISPGEPVASPSVAPLSALLESDGTRWPSYLEPWLGSPRGVPEATLPDGPFSATGLFTSVSHCMYQAYAKYVLELKPVEEVTDDLDPREVGTAVHEAIQRASPRAPWRVPADERPAAAARLVAALEEESKRAFDQATANLGALSSAREASARGRLHRWHNHWPAFAASRLGDPPYVKPYDQLKEHPAFLRAVDTMRALSPSAAPVRYAVLCKWLQQVAKAGADTVLGWHPDLQLETGMPEPLPSAMLPDLPRILQHEDIVGLKQVHTNLVWRANAAKQPVLAMGAEVPFGPDAGEPAEWVASDGTVLGHVDLGTVEVEIGSGMVSVRGQIDRLLAVQTRHGPLVEITDYKTGRAKHGWSFRRSLHQLADPQLLIYAMVMETVRDRPGLPEALAGARVATVAWDHVRSTFEQPTRRDKLTVPDTVLWVDRDVLDRGRTAIGAVLDRAREGDWPLRPRPNTCPRLDNWGHDHCPFSDVCRFRALPPERPAP